MRLLRLAGQLTAGILLAFTLRRAVLLLAALAAPRGRPRGVFVGAASDGRVGAASGGRAPLRGGARPILLLVPCRNEAAALPGLLAALDSLDYPRPPLQVVIIDDGSADDTAAIARAWADARPWADVLSLPASQGKAAALNAAVQRFGAALPPAAPAVEPGASGVAVYDADHRPRPDALRRLSAALNDTTVGAAGGQMRVANGDASPAAFYAHLESLVNQGITMRAKDRLELAPALLGANCVYRLSALQSVGGFRAGALLEDSDLTLALSHAGWRTRFVPRSISDHNAPTTLRGYLAQHLRWNRGFQQAGGARLGAVWSKTPHLSLLHKLELTFFALGYADRLALAAAGLLTAADAVARRRSPGAARFPRWVWLAYFGVPGLEMLAALRWARQPASMYLRLAYVPFFFALDLGAAVWSALQGAARRPVVWTATERGE